MAGHRASRAFHSEREAWDDVLRAAQFIMTRGNTLSENRVMRERAREIVETANSMLAQLKKGIHENPPLTVFSLMNPPRRGGALMSEHLYCLEYQHKANGKDYFHEFRKGTQMLAMPDGSVVIRRPGAKVWADLPGE